jgi:hypothetical protein
LALLYALGWYTPVFAAIYGLVPGVSLFRRPADAVFLVGGLLAILAGYGAHRMLTDRATSYSRWQIAVPVGGLILALLVSTGLAWWFGHLPDIQTRLGVAVVFIAIGGGALFLAALRMAGRPLLAAAMLTALLTFDLGYNNGPNSATALPPVIYEVLEPASNNATIAILKSRAVQDETRRDRIELAGLGFHWPNASLTHRLENTLGYNPLRLALYSDATGADDHVGLPDQRQFSPLFPSYRSKLADLLGLRFIATGAPVENIDRSLEGGELPLIARTSDGYIYENPGAMPRVSFATAAMPADFARMVHDGTWPDVDLSRTVLLQTVSPASTISARRPGTVRIGDYRNTRVTLEVDSPEGGWAVLNDPWHPWWFADIDGAAADILRANVLFRAVAVPPGRHKVHFAFRPLAGALAQLKGRQNATPRQP